MTQPTIDLATFKELQDTAGEDFVAELVGTFLQEAPGMLGDMRDALAAGDAAKFRRAAHSLKSNSLTFGAMNLGDMARELEHKGLEHARQEKDVLGALAREYAQAATALAELRNG
jgi:histidine phosphotransfer protein HptB